jgi:hypothetical protein
MIVVPHRVRPNLNGPKGIVATARIEAGMPVWGVGPDDRVLDLEDIQRLTSIEFEALLSLGFIRLAYSRQWVIAGDFRALNWSAHNRPANLKIEFDMLTAAKDIKRNEELIAPAEFDADRDWKNRMLKSGGWKRKNDKRAAKPDLKSYVAYVHRTG